MRPINYCDLWGRECFDQRAKAKNLLVRLENDCPCAAENPPLPTNIVSNKIEHTVLGRPIKKITFSQVFIGILKC